MIMEIKCLKRIKREYIVVNYQHGQEVVICEVWRKNDNPVFRLQIGTTFIEFNGVSEWNKFLDMVNNLNNAHQTLILRLPESHWSID
jgi:coenzyme F420-reducing hydrogenase delta subunit